MLISSWQWRLVWLVVWKVAMSLCICPVFFQRHVSVLLSFLALFPFDLTILRRLVIIIDIDVLSWWVLSAFQDNCSRVNSDDLIWFLYARRCFWLKGAWTSALMECVSVFIPETFATHSAWPKVKLHIFLAISQLVVFLQPVGAWSDHRRNWASARLFSLLIVLLGLFRRFVSWERFLSINFD